MKKAIVGLLLLLCYGTSRAQFPGQLGNSLDRISSGAAGMSSTKSDSLGIGFEHRDDALDSIAITYRYVDSSRNVKPDSSINDFYKYFSVPVTQQYLGNNGTAGYSLIYKPFMKAGWDAGFHAFDIYKYTLEDTRFYKTTKPYTQLSYQLASGKEQMIKVLHTQNPTANFNFGFEYRLISSPGFFVTQNTNHNNFRIFSNYQGKRKRYNAYFAVLGNTLKSSENGGIQNDNNLSDPFYSKRFTVPVNLGGAPAYEPNPFLTTIYTGNTYKDLTVFLRQTYDIGKKDSIAVNDSTTNYLFYPKLRFQHTFTYTTSSYQYRDVAADSLIYLQWYFTPLKERDTFQLIDKWKVISNDFSLLQFPDTKNLAQFFLVGARVENIQFVSARKDYYNVIGHAEYRNKTRNRLWDIFAKGELYLNGLNSGDYSAYGTLARYFNKKWGDIRVTASNVNRSPSFIYNSASAFSFGNTNSYQKENITMLKISAENSFINLSATNYLIANALYFKDYKSSAQYSGVFNLLQIEASKKTKLSKHWNWYTTVALQQTDAAAPVKVPLLFTRNRIAYEGLFFKNLNLSTGIEFRYYTQYNAYNYSPVVGQFTVQDTFNLRNRPDVSAFLHFRIKSFTGYIRAENLNAVSFQNGFGFTNNNLAAPHYAYPGFIFRFGIQWSLVN